MRHYTFYHKMSKQKQIIYPFLRMAGIFENGINASQTVADYYLYFVVIYYERKIFNSVCRVFAPLDWLPITRDCGIAYRSSTWLL